MEFTFQKARELFSTQVDLSFYKSCEAFADELRPLLRSSQIDADELAQLSEEQISANVIDRFIYGKRFDLSLFEFAILAEAVDCHLKITLEPATNFDRYEYGELLNYDPNTRPPLEDYYT